MFGGREEYIPEYIVVRGNLGERAVLFLQLLSRFETIKRKKKKLVRQHSRSGLSGFSYLLVFVYLEGQ